jgi:hypothetical protein
MIEPERVRTLQLFNRLSLLDPQPHHYHHRLMDPHDGGQKDFLSSLFSSDQQNHHQHRHQHQGSLDASQQAIFSYSHTPQNSQQPLQQLGLQSHMNPQMTLELLGSMMQGVESQAGSSTSNFSQHTMLEQQFKLTQLQQLQQLQNQIFQQQVVFNSFGLFQLLTNVWSFR